MKIHWSVGPVFSSLVGIQQCFVTVVLMHIELNMSCQIYEQYDHAGQFDSGLQLIQPV